MSQSFIHTLTHTNSTMLKLDFLHQKPASLAGTGPDVSKDVISDAAFMMPNVADVRKPTQHSTVTLPHNTLTPDSLPLLPSPHSPLRMPLIT